MGMIKLKSNTSLSMESIVRKPVSDWFLPSKDELNAMYINLAVEGVGGFASDFYWSSTESNFEDAWEQNFLGGIWDVEDKSVPVYVRACRSFTANVGTYSLRSIGPTGGFIFYILGTTFYEAAKSDQSIGKAWSNVFLSIGTTSTVIGEGQNNTNEIIAQAGHIDSAAKVCDDLSITGDVLVSVVSLDLSSSKQIDPTVLQSKTKTGSGNPIQFS